MRDKLFHDYFETDFTKLWKVATRFALDAKPHVAETLAAEIQQENGGV